VLVLAALVSPDLLGVDVLAVEVVPGAALGVDDDGGDDDGDDDAAGAGAAPAVLAGLSLLLADDAYRSLYQPPPLSWNEVRLMALAMVPALPQAGQDSGAGSVCFWSTSSRWAQASQRYSNRGMGQA